MQSWKSNKGEPCYLPERKIEPYGCIKTHPIINIAEDISNAPRACNTVSLGNVHNTVSGISHQNKWTCFKERIVKQFSDYLKVFDFLPEWMKAFSYKAFRKLRPEKLTPDHISEYVETREWATSIVRAMAWHPLVFKMAIASSDDVVRFYIRGGLQSPMIKAKPQKHITCLAWRPFAIDEIAVGCAAGIVFWSTDTPKEDFLNAALLKHQHHCPVTSLEWRSDGLLLASASPNDSNILLWNVDTGQRSPLRRFKPKCCFIRWAPKTSNLFCATTDPIFRIWNVKGSVYDFERWQLNSGRMQCAVWSPCGQILLFATDNDTVLYRLLEISSSPFVNCSKQWHVIPDADLSTTCPENKVIGGLVQAIAWDPRGYFVGVIFKESNSVALFLTKILEDNFCISPYGYISERDEDYPITLCFQSLNSFNESVVLTISWSNGTVKFYQLMAV